MKTKKLLYSLTIAIAVLGAAPVQAQTPEQLAQQVLAKSPVIDGHNDVPEQIAERFDSDFSKFDFRNTLPSPGTKPKPMHTDIARLRMGKVGGQFWSVWIDPELPKYEAVQKVIEQIDIVHRLIEKYPADLQLALNAADIDAAQKNGRIASLIGMEGGHSIGNSLAVLRQTYTLGARYMTLTHWKTLDWADSATDAPKGDGLSEFGVSVVQEMNRLGMIVDISHVSEATMNDALDATKAPVIFSHSSADAVTRHPRNVPDPVLKRLPANGGVVMVTFVPSYINAKNRDWDAAQKAEEARAAALFPGSVADREVWMTNWNSANPMPPATAKDVADHIDHIRDIAGIDHIGIGGDYDGITFTPDDLGDVSTYPVLFAELASRGYSAADLTKIARGNVLRVLRGVESTAANMAKNKNGL
ncbi:dipeptidase [Parasphingorhabdus halotolerans]|uniref:Membrane dipeptidase n=1 Tax=Parasphingorhabdus halotolerans TaxID=2725558 RepID=A0A6H2DJZ6_9SPHN|nr:dipeptidase [Parasphingorhabdus halotolerans]QJB68999.1 membrane dipeptidase [Parasphingorhabdus halotolerans]